MTPLRILLAGVGRSFNYEEAFAEALSRHGAVVHRFSWDRFLRGALGRMQEKWALPGASLPLLNRALLAAAVELQPDVVFVWRGTMIRRNTLERIRARTGALLVSYNNDDPFSWRHANIAAYHRVMWRHYIRAIPDYDIHFVFRHLNVQELRDAGAREVHVLKPYYIPSLHRPLTLTPAEEARYRSQAVFVGHYEPDGREHLVRSLMDAGVAVKVFGSPAWSRHLPGNPPVVPLDGLDYARALNAADIGLCFLSRLNRDSYTIRCFEIPACETVLLSTRTTDLQNMFREDVEAVYFSTPEELVVKARWLLADDERRQAIARAGRARLLRDGHSVDDRAAEWLGVVNAARARRSGVPA
jgi:glycosyltransferase involved in cell wall biosynthesis